MHANYCFFVMFFLICLQGKWEVEHGKIDPFFTLKKIAADEDLFIYTK